MHDECGFGGLATDAFLAGARTTNQQRQKHSGLCKPFDQCATLPWLSRLLIEPFTEFVPLRLCSLVTGGFRAAAKAGRQVEYCYNLTYNSKRYQVMSEVKRSVEGSLAGNAGF
jgi:hypothetical protein